MKKKQQHFFHKGGWAVFSVITWEVVEELIEEVIAFWLSSAFALFITKTITTLGIVFATIGLKKLIFRLCKPIIKSITYEEGNDKMTKIKKFFTWIFANKKTLIGTLSGAVMVASGSGIIDVSALPDLTIGGFNWTPVVYFALLGVLTLIGVFGKGLENIKGYFDRVGLIKAQKEQNAIVKQAEKELKAEEKKANQTEAETEAQKEKEKAEAEYRAKVEQAKAELKAKQG